MSTHYLTGYSRMLTFLINYIYLACAELYLGTSLTLDTSEDTITGFCDTGPHITVPYEEYEALPEVGK
jgi:hypothetical protein